jgi:hypothetical protein
MAPHRCACKLNIIVSLSKIFSPTFTFEINRGVLLEHIFDIIAQKMVSLSIVEAFATIDDLAH